MPPSISSSCSACLHPSKQGDWTRCESGIPGRFAQNRQAAFVCCKWAGQPGVKRMYGHIGYWKEEMIMKLRTLFIITAAFFAMNAPIALLFPMTQLSLYGVAAGPGASYMAQWAGLGSVAVALTAWFARNLANSEWRRGTRTHADDLLYSGLRYISAGCIFRSNERDGMVARGYLPVIRHWIRILSIEAGQLLRFISCCQVKCYLMLRLNPLLERTGDSAIFTQPRCIIGVAGWPLPGLPAPGLQAQVVLRPSWAGSANEMPRMHAAP